MLITPARFWAVRMMARATAIHVAPSRPPMPICLRRKTAFDGKYPEGRGQPDGAEPGKNPANRRSGRRMRCFKCNPPDYLLSSCPKKQLYADEHGGAAPPRNFLVDVARKCFNVGVFRTQTACLMADNHCFRDTGASRSMAPRKWFRDHGKWLKSHGRNPHTLEPGGAMSIFGNGNVT